MTDFVKPKLFLFYLLCLFAVIDVFPQSAAVGESMPLWSEGYLDIHNVNTGKGESTFFILPDGTTMLVDAGVATATKPRAADQKPSNKRTPGEWIARYIQHFTRHLPNSKLDYVIVSHFHEDHIGGINSDTKISKNGDFRLTGISEVGEIIPCKKIIDRGWPEYDWPVPLTGESAKNYIQFVNWQVVNRKMSVEKFRVGVNNQVVLIHNAKKYPDFEIRNIAANGHIWTGIGSVTRNYFPDIQYLPKEKYPNENMCSIAFRLSYGKFDYFSGGDIYSVTDEVWQDIESPVGMVTGPVEVCKANHHANFDAMGKSFLESLRPQVIIIQNWLAQQPDMSVLRRMLSTKTYPGPRDVFTTNMMEETRVVVGWAIDRLKSDQGHVIIRVNPGGNDYMIFVLDDSNEKFQIKAKLGPYNCD
jgi:beta-lactamase superfamily II metal-dependent hydrolase